MAEVGGISRAGAGAALRAQATSGPAFAMEAMPPARAAGGAPAAGVAAVSLPGLLALHEAGVEAPGDRAARRRGRDILAALAALQRGLLGGDDGEALPALARLARDLPPAADPRLDAVLRAVALRARVELARRGLDTAPGRGAERAERD
ncbi:MAG: hypothetical protein JO118_10975 [Acetobacteraceae bacterium]|nr:hypothetical protein [Acetobacteraceae bacterium]